MKGWWRVVNKDNLREVLRQHEKWLCSHKKEGIRANLRNADLRGADLTGADYIEGSLEVAKL